MNTTFTAPTRSAVLSGAVLSKTSPTDTKAEVAAVERNKISEEDLEEVKAYLNESPGSVFVQSSRGELPAPTTETTTGYSTMPPSPVTLISFF